MIRREYYRPTLGAHAGWLVLGMLLWLVPGSAWAHTVGLSQGVYRLAGDEVSAELYFSPAELEASLDGESDAPLITRRDEIAAMIVDGIEVSSEGQRCPGELGDLELIAADDADRDGLRVRARFQCPSTPALVTLELEFLAQLSRGHRHLVTAKVAGKVTGKSESATTVAYSAQPSFQINASPSAEGVVVQAASDSVAWPLFSYGFEHILTGYDHLVFLFGLIVIGGRLRAIFFAVTAFTIGHSLSLCAGVFELWVPSSAWIEPLIALSIAYVGIENFIVKDLDRRWRITMPFGFIHGFGFAGALQEISVDSGQLPIALLNFNLGVEAGQIAALAVALPLLALARHKKVLTEKGTKVLNASIVVAGLFWFGERILGLM